MHLIRKLFLGMLWLASLYLAAVSLPGCVDTARKTTVGTGTGAGADWTELTNKANAELADEKNICK